MSCGVVRLITAGGKLTRPVKLEAMPRLRFLVLLAAAAFFVPPAHALGITLNDLDTGWYRPGASVHDFSAISGEFVGARDANGTPLISWVYRGYYIFDLSGISAGLAVTGAVLHMGYTAWSSINASESYRIYDANAEDILALGPGFHSSDPFGTYEDLGSGTAYGDFTVTNSVATFDVALNQPALAALTAALGDQFGFGFDLLTNDAIVENEHVVFTSAPTLDLTLEPISQPVPEPGTVLLLGTGALALARKRLRRS